VRLSPSTGSQAMFRSACNIAQLAVTIKSTLVLVVRPKLRCTSRQFPLDKNPVRTYTTPREGRGVVVTTGRGAAWLARYNGVVEVPGSNPGAPTERQPAGCLFLRSCQVALSVLH
jgi:hypothetical protein